MRMLQPRRESDLALEAFSRDSVSVGASRGRDGQETYGRVTALRKPTDSRNTSVSNIRPSVTTHRDVRML